MVHGFIRKSFLAAICCLPLLCSFGQDSATDSLLKIIAQEKDPEKLINALVVLSYQNGIDQKKALGYAKQANELAKEEKQ